MGDFKSLKKQEELLNTYSEERKRNYKDRHYCVRDIDSVMRLSKDPTKPRKKAISKDGTATCLKTLSENGVKQFGVITLTMKDGWFVHEWRGYFHEGGQDKYFTIAKGEKWIDGDVFDDFC